MKKYTLLSLLLAAVMLLSAGALPAVAAAPEKLDFSDAGSPVKVNVSASEFLTFLLGKEISATEADFLDSKLGDVFSYSEYVPQKNVEATYRDGELNVTAEKYEHSSPGGKVVWIPTEAVFAGKSTSLSYSAASGKYTGRISGVTDESVMSMTVTYTCSLPISAGVANGYINYTYDHALLLWNENAEYERRVAAYNAYQEYLAELSVYDSKKEAFDKYVADMAKYEEKYAAYEQYVKDFKEYEEKLEAYRVYKEMLAEFEAHKEMYENYLAEKAEYEKKLKEYEVYLGEIEKVKYKLEVFDSVFVDDYYGRSLYKTLTGDTVALVLEKVDANIGKLEAVGSSISRAEVLATADNTEEIRGYLESYKALQSPGEKLEYYKDNYSGINRCFSAIYGSLHKMFNDDALNTILYNDDEDHRKFYKYIHMLCQLYVVCTGLDDTQMRDDNWKVKGEVDKSNPFSPDPYIYYSFKTELDGVHLVADRNNADPSDITGLPDLVLPPDPPRVFEEPKMPTPVEPPVEPDVILEPDPPETVEDPGEAPAEVENPGAKPEPIHHTAEEAALIAAIDDKTLVKRSNLSDKTFTVSTKVEKTIVPDTKSEIRFYDYDGKTLLYSVTLEKGDKISYEGSTPTQEETNKYTYEFAGWKDDSGNFVTDFGTADRSHISFYASYRLITKTYTVTWIVEGKTTTEIYEYGDTPKYKGSLEKEGDDQYSYVFAGWSTPVSTVYGNAQYTAQFEKQEKQYTVTWVFGEKTYTEKYYYGDEPAFTYGTDKFDDGEYIYEFSGWDKPVEAVKGDVTYTATFNKTNILENIGGEDLDITSKDNVYVAVTEKELANVEKLLAFAKEQDKDVTLVFKNINASMALNEASIAKLCEIGCDQIGIYIINEEKVRSIENYTVGYGIRFMSKGESISDLGISVSIKLDDLDKISAATKVYNGAGETVAASFDNDLLTLKLKGSDEIYIRNEYKITVDECKNGVLSANKVFTVAGDKVTVSLSYADSYEKVYLKVVGVDSGKEYTLGEDGSFDMPEENVTVSAELKLREFTVIFEVDGVIISEEIYHKGDKVTVPADPTKEGEGDKVYTFIGWSPVITAVTEDVTYVAEFKESVKSTGNPYFEDEKGTFYLRVVLVIIAVLLIFVGTPVAIVLVRKNKKKKMALAESNAAEASETAEGSNETKEADASEETNETNDSEDKPQE